MAAGSSPASSDTGSLSGPIPRTCKLPRCPRERLTRDGQAFDSCCLMHACFYCRIHHLTPPVPRHLPGCKLSGCDRAVRFEADTGRVHDFCCNIHADDAIARGLHPPPNRMVQTEPDKALRCHLYGCSARRYTDPETGHMHDFCGWTHSYKALVTGQQAPPTANLSAHASVPILEGSFIATFGGRAGGPDYSISLMTNRHPKYKRIKQEFLDGWGVDAPVVVRIWQVRNSADIWQQYRQYEDEVGQKARRLHGTKMTCSFAVDINQRPCDDPECSVCSICESGFKLSRARGGALTRSFTRLNGQLRYGTGLYFSKHLRKSHGYAVDSQQPLHAKAAAAAAASASGGSKLVRCMFLCRVALGVPLRTVEEKLDEAKVDAGIKARGQGGKYDSVLGLTEADGGRLNYEDNVLYDERAAIPSYLIVYEVPGPARPGQ